MAIWVWVINLQDTVNAMYIGVKIPEAGVNFAKAMQARVSINNAGGKGIQAHFIARLELQKIISVSAFIQNLFLCFQKTGRNR